MRLILVRHGETVENEKGIIQGHLDGVLNEKGIAQANELALRLKSEKIDVIFSSDLKRAYETAKIIARYHPSVVIKKDFNLRERSWKEYEGKNMKDYDNIFELPGIEDKSSFFSRVKRVVDSIKEGYKDKTVLIVCHGGVVLRIVAFALNKTPEDILQMGRISNTAVTIFDPYPKLERHNCVEHLEGKAFK